MAEPTDTLFDDERGFSGRIEVRRRIFAAADDGYAVVEAVPEGSRIPITVIGPLAHLDAGDRAEVSGEWTEHRQYGRQLRARTATPLDPSDREGRIAYLATLKHIGPARAERLVDAHGDEVMEVIAADPVTVFSALSGLSREKAESTAESWYASRAVRDLHVQLAPHGLAHLAARLHGRYGDEAMTVLHNDPYRLTEVDGVGFARADTIAMSNDVPAESDRRAQAAAWFVISQAEQEGHTHLPAEELYSGVAKLIGLQAAPEVLANARGVVVEGERFYRRSTYERELWCVETLQRRAAGASRFVRGEETHGDEAEIASPQDDSAGAQSGGIFPALDSEPQEKLTEEQWHAVRSAFAARLSVVTGGPGVGKTMCTREIVAMARDLNAQLALCAPTGRAARRLEEATGHEAQTIHRMLEWRPGDEPGFRPGHELPAEIVVVDEASMLNLQLLEMLLGGLAESTHIVFVGDADQLPPVGAGKPFADLIASGTVPVTRLTQIFRQAARSMITTAAHAINQGEFPALDPGEGQTHDFYFMERVAPEKAAAAVVELVGQRVSAGLGLDPIRDVQVLAPMYRHALGIDALNERLQERVNPQGAPACRERFRIGDRLIQTRNSHELGLMNGSICFLLDDDPEEEMIEIETDDGATLAVSYEEAETLRPAYAISVHKSQGCEVPVVVFICHNMHAHMLTRPLVYTAITRARRHCVVVGTRVALAAAVGRDDAGRRHSALASRLRRPMSSSFTEA